MSKKNTVRRKMSMRDYITFINFIENSEREIDLSEYDTAALDKAEIRVMYLTPEQKAELPNFITGISRGVSVKQLLSTIPKVGIEQFIQVPIVKPEQPGKQTQPEMILAGEEKTNESKAKAAVFANLPHWIKNPAEKISPENIDAAEIVRILENGEQTLEEMQNKFVEIGTYTHDNPNWLLAAHPTEYDVELEDRYAYAVMFLEVLEIAAKKHTLYLTIMSEEPPSEEENYKRYFDYVLSCHGTAKNKELYKYILAADEATSVEGNKIVLDNNDETTLEYENAEDMTNDFLYAVYLRKIGRESQVDIFGKKITAEKIVQKFYKKYPKGIPDCKKFYRSRKEAFEDGALQL